MTDENVDGDLANDLAALVSAPRYRPGPPCGVSTALNRIGQRASTALAAAIDNESVSASSIAKTLTERGYPMASQSISRHRRRGRHNGCRCER